MLHQIPNFIDDSVQSEISLDGSPGPDGIGPAFGTVTMPMMQLVFAGNVNEPRNCLVGYEFSVNIERHFLLCRVNSCNVHPFSEWYCFIGTGTGYPLFVDGRFKGNLSVGTDQQAVSFVSLDSVVITGHQFNGYSPKATHASTVKASRFLDIFTFTDYPGGKSIQA
jgi:hypothetical protein